jgi:hypothetical protein
MQGQTFAKNEIFLTEEAYSHGRLQTAKEARPKMKLN